MEAWQGVVAKHTHWMCLYADQDFSGAMELRKDVDLDLAASNEKVIMDALHVAMVLDTLSRLRRDAVVIPDEPLQRVLHVNRDRVGSTLTSLRAVPSSLNVGELSFFKLCIEVPLSRSTIWKKNKSYADVAKRDDILEFQYCALRRHYFKLVDDGSPEVFRSRDGAEAHVTMHSFMWDALKAVHRLSGADLDNICLRMLGDVKTKSWNPGLRHTVRKVVPIADVAADVGPAPSPFIPTVPPVPLPAPPSDPLDAPLSSLMPALAPAHVAAHEFKTPAHEYMALMRAAEAPKAAPKMKLSAMAKKVFAANKS